MRRRLCERPGLPVRPLPRGQVPRCRGRPRLPAVPRGCLWRIAGARIARVLFAVRGPGRVVPSRLDERERGLVRRGLLWRGHLHDGELVQR